jgi:ribosome-binding factor A
VFVEPLGGERHAEVVAALNRHAKFIRGCLGRRIDLRFTPDLKFLHDESFNEAARIGRLFDDPRVRQDLRPDPPSDSWKDED